MFIAEYVGGSSRIPRHRWQGIAEREQAKFEERFDLKALQRNRSSKAGYSGEETASEE